MNRQLKWVPWPFTPDGGHMMAIGHRGYVYVVGHWHGRDNWQGEKRGEGKWLKDSKRFHGPDGATQAREWCEAQNRRHAPRERQEPR